MVSKIDFSAQVFGKVAVLYGGDSAEREVSLNSGQAVYEALKAYGIDAHLLDTQSRDNLLNLKQAGYDRAFVMLHGRGGEDGQTQALLDWQGMPYTGSGVLACALAMDKVLCKRLWAAYGLPVSAECVLVASDNYDAVSERLQSEVLAIKPALEGSSVGVSKVASASAFGEAIVKAGGLTEKIMAEAWIEGREITCAVLGDTALPAIEIIASNQFAFYDYEAKYLANDTRYLCPAPLDKALSAEIARLSLQAFAVVGGRGWGRVDFMLDSNNQPWLLEVNMVPGMTSHSLVPQAAAEFGYDFTDLVVKILAQTITETGGGDG